MEKVPKPERPPYTILIAENWQHVTNWCYENQVNPRDRYLIVVTANEHLMRLRGLSLIKGYDRKIIYSEPRDRNFWDGAMFNLNMVFRQELLEQ